MDIDIEDVIEETSGELVKFFTVLIFSIIFGYARTCSFTPEEESESSEEEIEEPKVITKKFAPPLGFMPVIDEEEKGFR